MADIVNQDVDNISDISDFSDASDGPKKEVAVVEEIIEESEQPLYKEEDLDILVEYIRDMVFLFDYDENEFGDSVAKVARQWLLDVTLPMLFIFYDGDTLSASVGFPLCPFNDMMYFMRKPEQLFNVVERFHDDIMFGTLHNDIEGTLLARLEQFYGPLFLSNAQWTENVKGKILSGYNAFMTHLTELHYKLSGLTLLYIPREGTDAEIQEVVLNRSVVKRLEAVVIDWTAQIRSTMSDTEHYVPGNLVCPVDEFNFWQYRYEVLCVIRTQLGEPNVQHLLKILELSQSLYIKPLREVLSDLDGEILRAESNIPFLKLLVDPCFAIRSLETEDDLCSQIIYVIHIIRFIGTESTYLRKDESITKLFLYLSNEIVSCCVESIDINKILTVSPEYGIEICNTKINGCESYKIIYEEMLKHYKKELTWNLDYATIFNKINAFIQRLNDVLEICDAMLIFGKYNDSKSYKNYRFSCNNPKEYEDKCDKVEKIFADGIEVIQSVSGIILDINNKEWYKYIATFREMLMTLDDIIENLLSNVFLIAENLEEKVDVLITLLNFYKRESIKESFTRKIVEVWTIFHAELIALSKEVSSGISWYPSLLTKHTGPYIMLKIKFNRIDRLRELLERCRFFPHVAESDEALALFESCEKQVKTALKGFTDSWVKFINADYGSWLNRHLVCRSQTRPGLLECHIERRLLVIMDEAYFFKVSNAPIPSIIDMDKNEVVRLTFDNVIRIVIYFNDVVSSVSEKERLFFKPMIQQTERKLEPLRSKLTWDDDLGEFIDTFVTNVKELLDVIQVYKQENLKIAGWMEAIYQLYLFDISKKHAQHLKDLQKYISDQKKVSLSELVRVLSEISKNIFCIYENLGSNIRRMTVSWAQYVQKIDRLLKAAIFNSALITLENIEKALTTNPFAFLKVELVLGKHGITFYPTLESIQTALKRLPAEVTSTIKIIPSMCQKFQIDSEQNLFEEFMKDVTYLRLDWNINQAIENTIDTLRVFKEKWNVFRPFWSVNRTAFIEKFKLSSMTAESFQKNIEKFEELLNQLSKQNDVTVCKCTEVDAVKLKYAITNHIHDWQNKYVEYLKCISYGRIIEFNKTLNANIQALSIEPKEVGELKQLEATFNSCQDCIPDMCDEIKTIENYFDVLEKYASDLLPEATDLRRNIHQIWKRYMDFLNQIKEQIENYQNQFKLTMAEEVAALKVNAIEMLKLLDVTMPTSDTLRPEEAFPMLEELFRQLEELEAQERMIRAKMELLGIEYHPLDVIITIRKKLETMQQIWQFVDDWIQLKDAMYCQKYVDLNEGFDIKERSELIVSRLNDLNSQLEEDISYPIYTTTRIEVLDFETTISVVLDMKTSQLRERHWSAISEILSTQLLTEEELLLSNLIDYSLHRHVRALKRVCYAARKEYEIELELEAIEKHSDRINYKISRDNDIFRISNPERCFSKIDDNIMRIIQLQQSQYRFPFEDAINYWEETLNCMKDLLECLLLIEDECTALYNVFKITSLSAELSIFNESFELCFNDWLSLMRFIRSANLRAEVCHPKSTTLEQAEKLRKRFEALRRTLETILEKYRDNYIRFYLIPDQLLIKLIADPQNYELLDQAMNHMFENINTLSFSQLDLPHRASETEIIGVNLNSQENFNFLRPIFLKPTSTCASIMVEVEQSIHESLKNLLRHCLLQLKRSYFRRVESGWLQKWILQACIKSAHIENTLHIRNALVQVELLGKSRPLKMLRTMHNRLLSELMESYKNLDDQQLMLRKKLHSLLVTEINTRDVIEYLISNKVSGLRNFEWLSQIRSKWNEQTGLCTISHLDCSFNYGYECKSLSNPLFITPHTNRLIMSVTSAMKNRFIPYLIGNNEDGVQVIEELSTELAVFHVTVRSDKGCNLNTIVRYITGIFKLQAWISFSAVENMPSQIVTMTNEIIKESFAKKDKQSILDLGEAKIGTQFQLFALTNDFSAIVPELDRTVLRPVYAALPDEEVVLQNMLCSRGIRQYRTMACLLKSFLKHIKFQFCHKQQLWNFKTLRSALRRTEGMLKDDLKTEHDIVINALREEFNPGMSEKEKKLFEGCVSLVFQSDPHRDDKESRSGYEDFEIIFKESRMIPTDYQLAKIKEILDKFSSSRPMLITGKSLSGKSLLLEQTLKAAGDGERHFKQYHVNPHILETIDDKEIFYRSKFDQIIIRILESDKYDRKCLTLDTVDLQACWVDCVSTLQDRYTTNDLGIISNKNPHLRVIIETEDLGTATPALVAKFEIVHLDYRLVTWKQIFTSWLSYTSSLSADAKVDLDELGCKCLEHFFLFRSNCDISPKTSDINVIQTFCQLYDSVVESWNVEDLLTDESSQTEAYRKLFFFCCLWSLGVSMNEADREKFDIIVREQVSDIITPFPLKGSVFQYVIQISKNSSAWVPWSIQDDSINNNNFICVPENISYQFIVGMLSKSSKPLLITSENTVGKSSMIKHMMTINECKKHINCVCSLTSNTTAEWLQRILSRFTINVAKRIVYPRDRKQLVLFLDDFHSVFGQNVQTTEFLRNLIERKFWYANQGIQRLKQTRIVAAMRSPLFAGPRSSSITRLLNKYHIVYQTSCEDEVLSYIFNQKITKMIHTDNPYPLLKLIAPATVNLIRRLSVCMPPTPNRPRYHFSLKTIGRILDSFCAMGTDRDFADKSSLLRLWIHECYRETWDLLEKVDYKKFYEIFNDTISEHFENTLHSLCPGNRSPLFYAVSESDGSYEDMQNGDQFVQLTETALGSKNAEIIVHQTAVEHAAKVLRVIRNGNAHMILLGRAGSGRSMICRLAVSIVNHHIEHRKPIDESNVMLHCMNIKQTDSLAMVERQLSNLFECCIDNRVLCLIFADRRDRINELMLEILNSIIVNGTIDGYYPCENLHQSWTKIRDNLHFVICAPVCIDEFRIFQNKFPSLCANVSMNYVHPLTEKSLTEISKKHLQQITLDRPILAQKDNGIEPVRVQQRKRDSLVQSTEERLQLATTDALTRMHSVAMCDIPKFSPQINVLCSWYFEMLHAFGRVLLSKRNSLSLEYAKFYNGIQQIIEATRNVTLLHQELEKQQATIAEYQAELEEFIENIELQTFEADEKSQEVAVKREKIGAEEIVCKQLAAVAEEDLEQAMPALNSAIAALDSLNKKDMNEIKSYSRPPAKVEMVLNAVMILLGKEPSWTESKRQLGEQKFLDTLRNFDRNNISEKTLKVIGTYARNPDLEPNKVGVVSKAAKSLMLWVIAIENYGQVYKYVGPKIRKMEEAKASLLEKQNALLKAEQELAELAEKLTILRNEYERKMKCKQELEEAARQMALKLERAKELINGLAGEKIRWTNSANNLRKVYANAIGDTLLAAGCLTYFGPLPPTIRTSLKNQWKIDLEALEIHHTEGFVLFDHLYDANTVEAWQDQGLPIDDLSLENATILLNSIDRLAFAIDPQGQIHRWLNAIYSTKGMVECDFDEDIPRRFIETAVYDDFPLLMYNVQQHNVFNLDDLQSAFAHACEKICRERKSENDNNGDKKQSMFLMSNENVVSHNSLMKVVNVVNFIVGLRGLEDKLLAIVVEHEMPSLEERKELLLRTISANKKTLIELEENILHILNTSTVPLLENEDLYKTLNFSKHTAEEINSGLESAEKTRNDLEKSRETYSPCATRASLLFDVIDSMKRVNSFYWFSLDWYFSLFLQSLEKSSRSQNVEERKKRINDFHTYNVYKNVCYALKQSDQRIFGFSLCSSLLYANEELNIREYNFLLYGAGKVDRLEQAENPSPEWISQVQWDNITEIDKIPGFRGIIQSFEEANDDWKSWYMEVYPESEKLPAAWERNLTKFQKYLLVRSLRYDRLDACLSDSVRRNLGAKFAESINVNLKDILSQSTAVTPILLVSSANRNLWNEVQALAETENEGKVHFLSANTVPIAAIIENLKTCVEKNQWLFIQDSHKSKSIMFQLTHIVKYLKTSETNPDFRLWLFCDINFTNIAINTLQLSIKCMFNEPEGIKQRIHAIYEHVGEKTFKKIAKNKHSKLLCKFLFSLAFFHSIFLERRKFQTLGWIKHHYSNVLDFHISNKLFQFCVNALLPSKGNANITEQNFEENTGINVDAAVWNFIKNACLEVGYGAHVNNQWDRRIYDVYCNEIFRPQITTASQCTLVPDDPSYCYPRDGNYQACINFINKQIPANDTVTVFGQNENAAIKYMESQSTYLLQMLAKLEFGSVETDSVQDDHKTFVDFKKVRHAVSELLVTFPDYLDYENATRIVGVNRTPVTDVLLCEISTYNSIVELASRNLQQIIQVLSGGFPMTDVFHRLIIDVHKNRVPSSWLMYPSDNFLSDWVLDLKDRVKYFRKWTETGQIPNDIVLGRFIKPQRFLNGVLKLYAITHNIPVTELTWKINIFNTMKPLVQIPIAEGFIARGVFLENAGWNMEKQCFRQPRILEMVCPMPPMSFKPIASGAVRQRRASTYVCPCYYDKHRKDEDFVISVPLNCGEMDEDTWIKYYTVLLLNK
ncbi:dynein axonemal heavy chain 2-like [Wyeomyia smithii]|uniref:dynein axonemal heavy chain 2-like n=1 Tax=Wyeomyia smithii TaxID=174621 RepID=UPI002467EF4E|nr:dynein axonemal heavy chain 2-like [Wyeomyia smithii]